MDNNRVTIIGAGIAGLFTAYYLNQRGAEVTVLDKDNGKDNCSYGNAGMIVPSHIIPLSSPGIIKKGLKWMLEPESPFYIRPRLSLDLLKWGWEFKKASTDAHVKESGPVLRDLLMASRELLIDFESEENSSFGYEKRGLFMFCNTELGLEKEIEVAEVAKNLGVPAEILTLDEVQKMEPDLDLKITGAIYYPKDAHLHPGNLMDSLKEILVGRGVSFHWQTEIDQVNQTNGTINVLKSTDGKEWKADAYVLCAGAWSSDLSKNFGLQMLMQAGKGYSITLEKPVRQPKNCGIFAERKVTMTPMFNTLRFAGTMEIVGTDTRINQAKINGLKKSVCEYLPEFSMSDLEGHPVWTGLRPCSPDGMPYVGRVQSLKNLYASTGQAMMGMSLAPSCGIIVADLITEGRSELDHPLINPNRFAI